MLSALYYAIARPSFRLSDCHTGESVKMVEFSIMKFLPTSVGEGSDNSGRSTEGDVATGSVGLWRAATRLRRCRTPSRQVRANYGKQQVPRWTAVDGRDPGPEERIAGELYGAAAIAARSSQLLAWFGCIIITIIICMWLLSLCCSQLLQMREPSRRPRAARSGVQEDLQQGS